MRVWLLLALIPVVAACSTIHPAALPAEPSSVDVSGRWIGSWSGTGIFNSPRDDAATLDLVQAGDRARGRVLLEGTIAAESVPQEIRMQGMAGLRVIARVSGSTVTLRHEYDRRLFSANLVVTGDGDRMVGDVHGPFPGSQIVLVRERREAPAPPPQAATPPAPEPQVAETPPAEPEPPKEVAMIVPEATVEEEPAPAPEPAEFADVPDLSAVHFDFNRAAIRTDAADVLSTHVAWLKEHPDTEVLIEGHTDERGSAQYNVALGERRAKSVMMYLATAGIDTSRVSTVSFGKERRLCQETTDDCRSENRRAEFRVRKR